MFYDRLIDTSKEDPLSAIKISVNINYKNQLFDLSFAFTTLALGY